MNTQHRPAMVYHVPYPLNPQATSASGIRPVKMHQAFAELGYRVFTVAGTVRERITQMRKVRQFMAAGGRIDFAYSESSTMPTALTSPKHLPLHPWLDLSFLEHLAKRGVPVGLFYRDIYWVFPAYKARVGPLISAATTFFYKWDLRRYRKILNRLYLPSMAMAPYVKGVGDHQFAALPPGCTIDAKQDEGALPKADLQLFYVGGMGSHYGLHECVAGVQDSPAHLWLCTRKSEWEEAQSGYVGLIGDRTEVMHESGADVTRRLASADIGVLFTAPQQYWEFAMPFKLFEYIGAGVPILASEGTLTGKFVAENGLGWTLPYDRVALSEFLTHLAAHPEEVAAASQRVREAAPNHTWLARAAQVRDDLTGKKA